MACQYPDNYIAIQMIESLFINKLLIGKTYWKSIILPSILYGTNIINLSEDDIKDLQIIENNVYRSILNAPPYAPNVTLRGEIGASLMKKRIIQGRLSYMKSIMSGRNQIMHIILEKLINEKKYKVDENNAEVPK